jgi:hypothetical protein
MSRKKNFAAFGARTIIGASNGIFREFQLKYAVPDDLDDRLSIWSGKVYPQWKWPEHAPMCSQKQFPQSHHRAVMNL